MSGPLVSIFFDGQMESLPKTFGATDDQITQALRRSVRKLTMWLQTQIAREASVDAQVPQKAFKSRIRREINKGGSPRSYIWIGVNPLPAERVGKPRQSKLGSRAGKHFFRKAFVSKVYNEHNHVWLRKGRARLPIEKVTVPISEGFEKALEKYEAPAADKFEEIFEHELKFAMGWFN